MSDMQDQIHAMRELIDQATAVDAEQSAALKEMAANTNEMLEVFKSWKGAMNVLDYLGRVAKPLGFIAAAAAAILGLWTAYRTGASGK